MVQKLSGQKVIDYLKPRFFDPAGDARHRLGNLSAAAWTPVIGASTRTKTKRWRSSRQFYLSARPNGTACAPASGLGEHSDLQRESRDASFPAPTRPIGNRDTVISLAVPPQHVPRRRPGNCHRSPEQDAMIKTIDRLDPRHARSPGSRMATPAAAAIQEKTPGTKDATGTDAVEARLAWLRIPLQPGRPANAMAGKLSSRKTQPGAQYASMRAVTGRVSAADTVATFKLKTRQ